MTFIQNARTFLAQGLLPRLQGLVPESEYVYRLIFREKADVKTARALRGLRKDQGADPDHKVLEDRALENQPYILLLGNAGSGKSFILTFACIQAIQRFLCDAASPFPLFLDLGNDLPTELTVASLDETLNVRHAELFTRAHTETSVRYALFLDGLDEVLRRSRPFINTLELFLHRHWASLARVVVACRRAAWSPNWLTTSPLKLEPYHADDLDQEEYAQILREPAERQAFFRQCEALDISALLDTPFDGFYLAQEFHAGRPLPSSRRACLDQRITDALRGRTVDRQDGDAPSVNDLRFLARQLACVGSFTHHSAWTPQEAIDDVGASQVLRSSRPVYSAEVKVLLTRPLFKKSRERFAFIHQLYQEFLAAEALISLPLRKQRQLLATRRSGQHRIQTSHRGIAMFLAEACPSFADHLISVDPLVAFVAEMPALPRDTDERLLKAVLDNAIAHGRAPWWDMPPRGERPDKAFGKHRPRDVASFLLPYLTSPHEMARIWGAGCAEAWSGAKALNETLTTLAHDPSQHAEIRTSAIAAIAATRDLESVRTLYDLFEDGSDEVRGQVLQGYRQVDAPAPQDFIAKLYGGSHNPNLHCLLQREAEEFGCTLDTAQLRQAFEAVAEHFAALRNLKLCVLRGLFRRAIELGFADVPADLILECWARRDEDEIYDGLLRDEETITELMKEQPLLFERVWSRMRPPGE